MDLIDRYVVEVARHLPEKTAADIATELQSSLEDALDGREAAAGRPADETMVASMLLAFGHPEAVAGRYRQPRSLIGPAWYPSFQYVAATLIAIVSVFRIGGLIVRAVVSPAGLHTEAVLAWAGDSVRDLFVGVAMTAFVIAGLERLYGGGADEDFGGWDPRDLPAVDPAHDSDAVVPRDVEQGIWGNVIMLVLLLAFPRWVGVPWGHQYHYTIVPLADLGIRLPLVLLVTFFTSALLLDVLLRRRKRWTRPLRRIELANGLIAAVALAAMILTAGPHLVNENWFEARGWPIDTPDLLAAGETMRRIVLAGLWGLLAWQGRQALHRTWRLRNSA